jgi:L-threonylcarbamoyladenylate synthase
MRQDELEGALAVLRGGGVVAAATETWFGLLADARAGRALDRVLSLKGRGTDRGITVLLPDRAAWDTLVADVPPLAALLARRFWPGPLTIALPARAGLDPRLVLDGTIGARWGAPSDACRIAEGFGAALTATSANRTGAPPLATGEEVATAFAEPLARGELLVVSGHAPGGHASTVIVVHGERARLVRHGAIDRAEIAAVVPKGALEEP